DSNISRDAPLRSDFSVSPRLAARAAPAAFCWAFDLAGMMTNSSRFRCPLCKNHPGGDLFSPPHASGDVEDDLADVRALLHPLMGAPGILKRKDHVHDRSDAALGQQGPDLLLQLPGDAGLDLDGLRAQGRPGVDKPLQHQPGEIDFRLRPAEKADLNDP